jgi:hypothetical protein
LPDFSRRGKTDLKIQAILVKITPSDQHIRELYYRGFKPLSAEYRILYFLSEETSWICVYLYFFSTYDPIELMVLEDQERAHLNGNNKFK